MKTSENGAQTSLYCAIEPSLQSSTGKYYSDCAECQPSDLVKNDVIAQKLWDVSMGMVGPIDAIPVRSDCPPWHPPPVQTAEVVKDAAEVELLQFEDQSVEVAAKRH